MMKTKQEIQKWILDNCVDEDGYIDLMDLDFGDKIVFLNRMKAYEISQIGHKARIIYQHGHKACTIYQYGHEARVIYQWGNKANEISQWGHKCDNVIGGGHISTNEMTLEEENKKLREEIERLKKNQNV